MTHVEPSDVGRLPPEDRPVHAGPHRFAQCGEWRPIGTNTACPYCPEVCPGCGTKYHKRGGG